MHFAVVADKLNLFLTYERAAEIEPIFDYKKKTIRFVSLN